MNDQATKVHEQINSCFLQLENKVSAKFLNRNSVTQSLPTTREPCGSVTAVSPSQIIKEYKDREAGNLMLSYTMFLNLNQLSPLLV